MPTASYVEILWVASIDRAAAERYFKQVSRTGRFALVVDLLWTESAPLRRKRDSVFDN
jgi:hypothetical protein